MAQMTTESAPMGVWMGREERYVKGHVNRNEREAGLTTTIASTNAYATER